MEAFTTHTGRAVPLRRSNVDTDQIIPAHWLKKVTRDGFEDGLFEAWRKDPEFALNQERYKGATVLVAGPDFGTGSSREHAVWALQNYGFKAVISSRFADIFRGNSLKNGLLTVVLPQETVDRLQQLLEADPSAEVTVDLVGRQVRAEGITADFELDENARWRLLEGLDDISLTLQDADTIARYEASRPAFKPHTQTTDEIRSIRLAVIPGDGIGQEVVAQGLKVLTAVLPQDVKLETKEYDLGARRWHATGETLPDEELESLKQHDALLLGAIGDPSVPSGVLERGLLLKLRFAFDHFVNLRPSKLFPNTSTPLAGRPDIDFVVVREGTEGPYTGNGGSLRTGTPAEVATEVSLNTAYGVERVVRDAYERANARPRKKLTLVHKNNVLVYAGHMWKNIFDKVGQEYPEVTTDYLHVDAATIFFVTQPERFDVIVTDNLFGDILTDLAAAVTGGIGLAASGNINPTGEFPSMFEPVHGSAPDIAGTGKADPTATVLSVALLLRHLGYAPQAARIEEAVAADLEARGDAPRTTDEIGDALAARVC
ncbi:3-isopropylmalate dehydrogenase [Streptomyces auratus]